MILDFNIFSNRRFQVGTAIYPRIYRVRQGKGGISLINLKTGIYLFKNLDPAEILIAGFPIASLHELQMVVYNMECLCDAGGEDEPKIFDRHFDRTFE